MRIAIISTGIVNINTFLKNQIKLLINQYNASITIITNTGANEELYKELKNLNVKIINISLERKPNIFIDMLTLFNLAILLKKSNFDMTITITPKAGFLGTLASFLKRIPNRIHIFTGQVWVNKKGLLRFLLKIADKIIYILSTKTLIDSKSQKDFLLKEKVLNNMHSDVILNGSICGVDVNKFKPNPSLKKQTRKEININDDDIVLLFVGRLNKDKGVFDLLDAFNSLSKKFDNIKLLMVGSDEEKFFDYLIKNYPNLKERVVIKNFTLQTQKYYICSDIFIMPSYREGFGLASIEASSCGLPVIASNIYGLIDSVKDGINGFLHEPGEKKKLESLVIKLIDNKNYITDLGSNGRKLAIEKYSQDKVIDFFCDYVVDIHNNLIKDNFFICGTSSHSMHNFRGDLITDLKKNDLNIIGFGSDTTNEDIEEIKKLKINYHDYSIDNTSINPFKDLLSFINLSYHFINYKPKYTMCYTIKAVIIFGLLKKIFRIRNKSFALITGVGNVFVSQNELLKNFVKIFYRISLQSYDKVFFQNNDDKLFFLNENLINTEKSTDTFRGSGVNVERFNSRNYPEKITFALASRMIKNKGINEFCEVAKRLSKKFSNIEFIICGDFTKSPYSLDKNKTLNLFKESNIQYFGWIKYMEKFYEKTSVYVLPSIREGTPRTVLEAMAMNRPIITNDVPGCRDTIIDGYNGFLTKLGNINDLEDKFKIFISNPNLIQEMGNNSRIRVANFYDVRKINRQMIDSMIN